MKVFGLCACLVLSATVSLGQTYPEGIWQGYDGEWKHVSQQLVALAEATPADKFAWRPAPGVRSTSEVYMHMVMANFYLLSVTGPKMPADLKEGMDKTVTSKAEVISWLKRSLDAVQQAHVAQNRRTSRARFTLQIETRRWMECICASLFMRMSIWGSWSRMRA
jgi:hypothetical protein